MSDAEDDDAEDDGADELAADSDGDPLCAGGCGYPVDKPGELCGECACEDDGDLY